MEKNIYFRNGEDLKKKACELIDNRTDFTVTGNCITIEEEDNVLIEYKCASGIIKKTMYIEGENMLSIINNIYKTVNLFNVFKENGKIISVKVIE